MHYNERRTHYAEGSGRAATGPGRAADHGPRDGRGKNNGDYIVTGMGENVYLCAAQQIQRKKRNVLDYFYLAYDLTSGAVILLDMFIM